MLVGIIIMIIIISTMSAVAVEYADYISASGYYSKPSDDEDPVLELW